MSEDAHETKNEIPEALQRTEPAQPGPYCIIVGTNEQPTLMTTRPDCTCWTCKAFRLGVASGSRNERIAAVAWATKWRDTILRHVDARHGKGALVADEKYTYALAMVENVKNGIHFGDHVASESSSTESQEKKP